LTRLPKQRKRQANLASKRTQHKEGQQVGLEGHLPKPGKPKTKEFEGKQYHVNYPYHLNQWFCHSAPECSKNPAADANAVVPDAAASLAPATQRLKAAKLAAAVLATKNNSGEESQDDDY
jgi:hypothetical protein